MRPIIEVKQVSKTYDKGFKALDKIDLEIKKGEIFALLGPNGAGKTTLISSICGIEKINEGQILVDGFDITSQYKTARAKIGLVPQELYLGIFDRVYAGLTYSRGLFNKPKDSAYLEQLLRTLSLWDKKDAEIRALSGGMKRRVLIAKALSHQPDVLFLDEPTAGVDVELRKDMWALVEELRKTGVTIILTTHYIEEAEAIADRIGIINHGQIILVEEKGPLIKKLGKQTIEISFDKAISKIPKSLESFNLNLLDKGVGVVYTVNDGTHIDKLLKAIHKENISILNITSSNRKLEDIFVSLIKNK